MASRRSSTSQSLESSLFKKFLEDRGFSSTAAAFDAELKIKKWNTSKKSGLSKTERSSVEGLLAKVANGRSGPGVESRHSRLKRKAIEDSSDNDTSDKPPKKIKRKHKAPVGRTRSSSSSDSSSPSFSSSSSSLSSSASSSSESSSSSSSSASESESEGESESGPGSGSKPTKKAKASSKDVDSDSEVSSSSSGESSSSEDSSDSEPEASTLMSAERDPDVSLPSSEKDAGTKLPGEDDHAASNSSDTVQGDKKPSPDLASSEDMHPERASAILEAKKHVGARPTPLAQLSAQATPDSHVSNAYVSYDYAERAYKDLSVTRGKGFTKEKNKKKRGSYRGGAIDIGGGKGFKFED
jgi:SRP40, C-terminal domain